MIIATTKLSYYILKVILAPNNCYLYIYHMFKRNKRLVIAVSA